ncbi:MAG: phosphoribosyltransferase [Thermoproteota archaeon]|nr:MAG: phosphoribosyltransferase [Candidatus Korarchaeota archaeon]
MEFTAPSWLKIYRACIILARKIRESGYNPEMIVGIARGGWIPARILSDLLMVREVASMRVLAYRAVGEIQKAEVLQPVSADVRKLKVLLVDDVADTGESLREAVAHLKSRGASEVKVATIYYKPWSAVKPDYWVYETRKWVIFPWEIREVVEELSSRSSDDLSKAIDAIRRESELSDEDIREVSGIR